MKNEERNEQIGDLASSLLQTVPIIYRRLVRKNDTLEGSNGDYPKIGILLTLRRRGPMPLSSLAKLHSYSRQNLTSLTDRLEEDGLVRRVRDAKDRRVTNLELTEEGVAYLLAHFERMKQALMEELADLDDGEVEILLASFENIRNIYVKRISEAPKCRACTN